MIIVQRKNVQITIGEADLDNFIAQGFKQVDLPPDPVEVEDDGSGAVDNLPPSDPSNTKSDENDTPPENPNGEGNTKLDDADNEGGADGEEGTTNEFENPPAKPPKNSKK